MQCSLLPDYDSVKVLAGLFVQIVTENDEPFIEYQSFLQKAVLSDEACSLFCVKLKNIK